MSKLTAAVVVTAAVVIAGGLIAAALIVTTDSDPEVVVQTSTTTTAAPSTTSTSTTTTTTTTSTTTTAVPSTTVDPVCVRLLNDQDDLLADSLLRFQQQHADAITRFNKLIESHPDDPEAQATLEEGKRETLRQMRARWEADREMLVLQMAVDAARVGCRR